MKSLTDYINEGLDYEYAKTMQKKLEDILSKVGRKFKLDMEYYYKGAWPSFTTFPDKKKNIKHTCDGKILIHDLKEGITAGFEGFYSGGEYEKECNEINSHIQQLCADAAKKSNGDLKYTESPSLAKYNIGLSQHALEKTTYTLSFHHSSSRSEIYYLVWNDGKDELFLDLVEDILTYIGEYIKSHDYLRK